MGRRLKLEELGHYDALLKETVSQKVGEFVGTMSETGGSIKFRTDKTEGSLAIELSGSGPITVSTTNSVEVYNLNSGDSTIFVSLVGAKSNAVYIQGTQNITTIDLSGCQITEIMFSEYNPSIEVLKVHNNKLQRINIRNLTALRQFHVYSNPIVDDCLDLSFTESDKLGSDSLRFKELPVLDKTSDSYKRLLDLMDNLPSRLQKSLGSVVLYPWYGQEVLIYEADGNHYETPDTDFSAIPNPVTTPDVVQGTLCKYPRRLTMVSPSVKGTNYKSGNYDVGLSARNVPGEWYTDEPLDKAIHVNPEYQNRTLGVTYIEGKGKDRFTFVAENLLTDMGAPGSLPSVRQTQTNSYYSTTYLSSNSSFVKAVQQLSEFTPYVFLRGSVSASSEFKLVEVIYFSGDQSASFRTPLTSSFVLRLPTSRKVTSVELRARSNSSNANRQTVTFSDLSLSVNNTTRPLPPSEVTLTRTPSDNLVPVPGRLGVAYTSTGGTREEAWGEIVCDYLPAGTYTVAASVTYSDLDVRAKMKGLALAVKFGDSTVLSDRTNFYLTAEVRRLTFTTPGGRVIFYPFFDDDLTDPSPGGTYIDRTLRGFSVGPGRLPSMGAGGKDQQTSPSSVIIPSTRRAPVVPVSFDPLSTYRGNYILTSATNCVSYIEQETPSVSPDEDTWRSQNDTIESGIEFDKQTGESLLYGVVRNYSISDPQKTPDSQSLTIDYHTFSRSGLPSRHPLTKYNMLRKALESDCTVKKNWFFGSAIQDTGDFDYCPIYFKESNAHLVWESVQKGFGRTWGIHDLIGGNQPDWTHKNIVRFTHFGGNTSTSREDAVKWPASDTYRTGQTYRTDPRLPYYSSLEDTTTSSCGRRHSNYNWSPNRNVEFGHGDHIVSYLLSQGDNLQSYAGDDISFKQYGLCPNATGYILDRGRLTARYSRFFTADDGKVKMMTLRTDPTTTVPQAWTQAYAYYKLENNIYTICTTVPSGSEYVLVTQTFPLDTPRVFYDIAEYNNGSFELSMKELYEHSDCSSMSWSLSDSDYLRYLNGRFGERRYLSQSSGNSGDGFDPSTESYSGYQMFGPYGDFSSMSTYKYHPTSYHATALLPGGFTSSFPNTNSACTLINSVFTDYISGVGTGLIGYNISMGAQNGYSGTSMSCPQSTGVVLLMMNLYKLIHPDYNEEPEYSSSSKLTSDLVTDNAGILTGGYGKFSPFMRYVETHWMRRPVEYMYHSRGIGFPDFGASPSPLKRHIDRSPVNTSFNIEVGHVVDITSTPQKDLRVTLAKSIPSATSSPHKTQYVFDWAVVNDGLDRSMIIPVRKSSDISAYLCENISAYGTGWKIKISDNIHTRPNGYSSCGNTYHYYPVTLSSSSYAQECEIAQGALSPLDTSPTWYPTYESSGVATIQMKIKVGPALVSSLAASSGGDYRPILLSQVSTSGSLNLKFELMMSGLSGQGTPSSTSALGYRLREFGSPYTKLIRDQSSVNTALVRADRNITSGTVSYLDMLEAGRSYVLTSVFERDYVQLYVNGTHIGSCECQGFNLSGIDINGRCTAYSQKSLEDFWRSLSGTLLVYGRKLSDYEIALNSACLLKEDDT